jgi:hypothetical protein
LALVKGLEESHHFEKRLQGRQTDVARGRGVSQILLQMGKEVEQELHLKSIEVWIGACRETALPEAEKLDEGLLVTQPGMRGNPPVLGQVAVEEVIEVG